MNVAVLGLGRVGLPLATYLRSLGHEVIGYDADPTRTSRLLAGFSDMPWEPGINEGPHQIVDIAADVGAAVADAELVYIIVSTPMERQITGCFLSSQYVENALQSISGNLGNGVVVVIGSTLEPADAARICIGGCVYNPPLIRLGHVIEDLRNASVGLVGGIDSDEVERVVKMWGWEDGPLRTTVIRGDPLSIATAKLAINVTLSMRIAWANEISEICATSGASSQTVLSAVRADPRIGAGFMQAGFPPGGPCLPRDLAVWGRRRVAFLARRVETRHRDAREAIIDKTVQAVQQLCAETVPRVAVLGLVYNVGAMDSTDSLGVALMREFVKLEWQAVGYDPIVGQSKLYFPFPTTTVVREAVERSMVVILTVSWPEFERLPLVGVPVIDLRRPK